MEIFTKANSTEAVEKIFEMEDEILEETKKTSKKKLSPKYLRSKRRKANAKEKNYRRKLGTEHKSNPYRGKPGDYYHNEHLWDRHGLAKKDEAERRIELIKAKNAFLGEVEKELTEEERRECVILQLLAWDESFFDSQLDEFIAMLLNKYSKNQILDALMRSDQH